MGCGAVLLLCRAVLLLGMRVLSRRLHVLPLHPSHLLLYELLLDTICAHLKHLSKRLDRHPIRQILYIVNGEGMCQKVADVCLVGAAAVCYLYLLIILHRLCAEEKEEIGMGGEKGREEEGGEVSASA